MSWRLPRGEVSLGCAPVSKMISFSRFSEVSEDDLEILLDNLISYVTLNLETVEWADERAYTAAGSKWQFSPRSILLKATKVLSE